jgi:hypothetical protein
MYFSEHKGRNAKTIVAWYARGHVYIYGFNFELTFAGLKSLKPPVVSVSVVSASTIVIPSAFRSATTDSARFSKSAALWAHHLIDRGNGQCARAGWCADWRANYF